MQGAQFDSWSGNSDFLLCWPNEDQSSIRIARERWVLLSSHGRVIGPQDGLKKDYVYGKYKGSLRAPTKENTLVLMAVNIGGKNTQE